MIAADVYAGGTLVGHFTNRPDGLLEFTYLESAARPVATSLPITQEPYITAGGALLRGGGS